MNRKTIVVLMAALAAITAGCQPFKEVEPNDDLADLRAARGSQQLILLETADCPADRLVDVGGGIKLRCTEDSSADVTGSISSSGKDNWYFGSEADSARPTRATFTFKGAGLSSHRVKVSRCTKRGACLYADNNVLIFDKVVRAQDVSFTTTVVNDLPGYRVLILATSTAKVDYSFGIRFEH